MLNDHLRPPLHTVWHLVGGLLVAWPSWLLPVEALHKDSPKSPPAKKRHRSSSPDDWMLPAEWSESAHHLNAHLNAPQHLNAHLNAPVSIEGLPHSGAVLGGRPPHPPGLHLRRSSSGGLARTRPSRQPSGLMGVCVAASATVPSRQPSGRATGSVGAVVGGPSVEVSRKLSDALVRCASGGFATLGQGHPGALRPSDFEVGGAAAVQVGACARRISIET